VCLVFLDLPKILTSHPFHYFVVPVLGLLSGAVGLFIDPKQNRRTALIVVAVLVAAAVSATSFGYYDDQQNDHDKDQQASQLTNVKTELDQVLILAQGKGALVAAKLSDVTPATVKQSLDATVALSKQLPSSGQTDIQYFSKDIDKSVVLQALQDAGFHFDQKKPQLPNDRTNAIWVGDPVPLSDAKVVALTLIRAGVQIQSIMAFPVNSSNRGLHRIQIGAYPRMDDKPVWTVEQVQSFNGPLPRDVKIEMGD
jgi:hypothetical protein